MKKLTTVLFFFCSIITYSQQKEWKDLVTILDEELTFFKGKKGYIQMNTWSYTDFEIQWGFVDETYLNWSVFYVDRFSGYRETTIEYFHLKGVPDSLNFCAIKVKYNYLQYYPEFPDYLFITLEVCPDQFIEVQSKPAPNPFGDELMQNMISIDEVDAITLPVRAESLPKILKAANAYMEKNIKPKLLKDLKEDGR